MGDLRRGMEHGYKDKIKVNTRQSERRQEQCPQVNTRLETRGLTPSLTLKLTFTHDDFTCHNSPPTCSAQFGFPFALNADISYLVYSLTVLTKMNR